MNTKVERHICTAEDPWNPEKGDRAVHEKVKRIGGDDNYWESYSIYKCDHCGKEFKIYYEG